MKHLNALLPLAFIFIMACGSGKYDYPETKKSDQTDIYHGIEVADPYRWLEDMDSEQTRQWIEAQNKMTFNYLDKIPSRDSLKEQIAEVWNYPKVTPPKKEGDYYFFLKNEGLQNQDVLYFTDDLDKEPEILLDPNKFSEDGTVALTNYAISKNGKYIAYSISRSGSDWNEIMVKDIEKNQKLDDHIKWVKFSGIGWYQDGFYYSSYEQPDENEKYEEVHQNHKVCYHQLGEKQGNDEVIFENEEYPERNYYAYLSDDEKYLFISEKESTSGNDLHIKNLEKDEEFTRLTTNFNYEYYVVDHEGDYLYIHTNYKAPKYKLIRINVNSLDIGNWRDIIPEKSDVLENCHFAGDKIVAQYLKDAKNILEVYDKRGQFLKTIDFPVIGSVNSFKGSKDDNIAYYSLSSFNMPSTIYKLNMDNFHQEIYYKPEINFNPDDYIVKQEFYKSHDGIEIPMFIVHKKGISLNGNNPTLLYGYGGFNISLKPRFKPERIVWLKNGGIFALANIRGGGEYGEKWHLAGKGFNKQNVFDDFISAASWLIDEEHTSPERMAIRGGSNGGLLIGAVINQRPDLFQVALPAVGVMDMLRFHQFTIGWAWVEEYGSVKDSAEFRNLYNYSPIHNIKSKIEYPAVLATTSDHDDRVVPAHSYKYIATLQEKYDGENPTLIRIQTQAGHGAGTPTNMLINKYADIYAFSYYNMNFNPFN